MPSIKQRLFKKTYQIFGRNSFSQAGEDVVIDFLLLSIGNKKPSYLELGVYEPRNGNNTYKFYVRGGRGVLVEADESLIATIKAERPGDTVLNCGVSFTGEKEAPFYIFNEPSINTFNKEEAEQRLASGINKLVKTVIVPLKTINEIISENFKSIPDILSIDIEGLDLEVLESLDVVSYPIPIIIAETCTYSETHIKGKDKRIEGLMLQKGYFVYADTYINTIFVHDHWFKNVKSK